MIRYRPDGTIEFGGSPFTVAEVAELVDRYDALQAERDNDYAGMREFQAKYINADHERRALQEVIYRAHQIMHGDGVMDQGQAWDECVRLLDAEMKKIKL